MDQVIPNVELLNEIQQWLADRKSHWNWVAAIPYIFVIYEILLMFISFVKYILSEVFPLYVNN